MTEPARSIGKLGFRKWYERRLIESHAWLITCFLCGLAIAASLEGLSFKRPEALFTLAFVFVAGLICWHALKRYRIIMEEAERLGESAVCGSCNAYGSFRVLGDYPKMRVRCRKCSNEWQLDR